MVLQCSRRRRQQTQRGGGGEERGKKNGKENTCTVAFACQIQNFLSFLLPFPLFAQGESGRKGGRKETLLITGEKESLPDTEDERHTFQHLHWQNLHFGLALFSFLLL